MKQVLFIITFILLSISAFSQTSMPKLENALTGVQKVKLIWITKDLSPFKIRVESKMWSHPCYKDKNDNLFSVILKNDCVVLVPTEEFDIYAQN